MSEWTIYYNPKCGTCRNTLEILKKNKITPRIVEYLKTPPTYKDLESIAKKLGSNWNEMIRTKEPIYEKLKLASAKAPVDFFKAIVENPVLLQRPIVIKDNRAVVARPPEKVNELL